MYGGDLWSTPFHWAVRAGHINIVTYLYKKSADPLLKDNQGYNSLHLAVHGGHSMVLSFLLAHDIDVDVTDSMGRTGLMWAAYKGNSMESLNVLIKWNADLNKTDLTGFTALHWAVVSGNLDFARALLAAGCNSELKDPSGKTALDWANERNYGDRFKKILETTGKSASKKFLSKDQATKILYIIPFILIPSVIYIFANFLIFISLPAIFVILFILQKLVINKILLPSLTTNENDELELQGTPFVTAIPQVTILLIAIEYVFVILPNTWYLWLENILFWVFFWSTTYTFYKVVVDDPGYIRPLDIEEAKPVNTVIIKNRFDQSIVDFVIAVFPDTIIIARGLIIAISVGITTNESVNFRRLEYLVHPDDLGKSTNDFDNDGDGEDDDEEKLETLKEAVLEPLSPHTKSGNVTVSSSVAPMYKRRLVNPFNQGVLENWRVFCLEGIYGSHSEEGMIEWDKLESVPKRLLKSERYLKRIGRWRSERSRVEGSGGGWMSMARLFRRDGEKSINDIV
ncbi:hypothetical protein HK098_003310 [Nowakowskiella sp. JEL0407]|nr:hypothetical protein HK098_003310 [Nowakowskiella sp. JEL0407]